MKKIATTWLRGSAALQTLALLGAGTLTLSPAHAQAPQAADAGVEGDTIVVTGSLFRRTDTETPSPVSVLTAETLERRGITTVAEAINTLSASNGGGLPQNFTNAFASGAQGVSLRGLSTNSTLVLFDGLRAAYYPLADDGQRSFVDLNTIPSAIVERVETLRDGASSTYGADAVAGVVNLIIRKEIKGLEARVEAGVAERGNPGGQRLQLTWGTGDLADNGWNFYVSGEYQRSDRLFARDRGFPYNTNDLSRIVNADGSTGVRNVSYLPPSTSSANGSTNAAVVRPATQRITGDITSGTAIAGGLYQVLQNGGCAGQGLVSHTNSTGSYCEQDNIKDYSQISPEQQRFGGTAHLTVNLNDDIQAYLMGTYYETRIKQDRAPSSLRSNNPIYTYGLVLPALLSNGALNPNNPYAASGQAAMLWYQFGDIPVTLKNVSRTYRIAGGIEGSFGEGWDFRVHGTYMRTNLTQTRNGFINFAGLTSAINNGTYNFRDPGANSQAVRDQISPTQQSKASSELAEIQAILTRQLVDLSGGPLQLAVGGEIRYENIDAPTANPGNQFLTINAFQAVGDRTVKSAFFELNAPVLSSLEINASGRYDDYSTGFSNFSPKIGAKFQPIREVAIRGTFAKGFRAPSIPETSGNVIGFVNYNPPASVIAAHGGNSYVTTYSLGLNSTGNPDLKPEKSTSFTLGAVFQPTSWLSLTVDYYNIKKKDVIYNPADSTFANDYMNGLPLGEGVTITPNVPDPDFPGLLPTPLFVNSAYANGQSLKTSGFDVQVQASFPFGDGNRFTSIFEGTRISKFNLTRQDGTVDRYVGTLGPYNTTSASGTPRYRFNWQNTLEVGAYTLSATTYYTSGYRGWASDFNGLGSCGPNGTPENSWFYNGDVSRTAGNALQCKVKSFVTTDLAGSVKITDAFTFYVNVYNLLDKKAPFDPNTYGGNNYNPAWASSGVIGRYFRAGATFKF